MWTSLALLSALSWAPAQAGQLELKNARFTYGILGQERKETAFLPGDMVVLAFDIDGLQIDADGRVNYSMSMELFDHKKKDNVFKKDPQNMTVVNTLGRARLPMFGLTNIGTDTEAGDYTITIVVKDTAANKSTKLERKFEVKKMEFGIVRPGFVYNKLNEEEQGPLTQMAPPVAVPGQNLMLHFTVVGFKMEGDTPQPDVTVTMEVKDEAGGVVMPKPFSGRANKINEEFRKLKIIPFQVPIQVNRSGKFKIVLTATDKNGNKTVTQTLDLKVVDVD